VTAAVYGRASRSAARGPVTDPAAHPLPD
jgi:hypothetical protein